MLKCNSTKCIIIQNLYCIFLHVCLFRTSCIVFCVLTHSFSVRIEDHHLLTVRVMAFCVSQTTQERTWRGLLHCGHCILTVGRQDVADEKNSDSGFELNLKNEKSRIRISMITEPAAEVNAFFRERIWLDSEAFFSIIVANVFISVHSF